MDVGNKLRRGVAAGRVPVPRGGRLARAVRAAVSCLGVAVAPTPAPWGRHQRWASRLTTGPGLR